MRPGRTCGAAACSGQCWIWEIWFQIPPHSFTKEKEKSPHSNAKKFQNEKQFINKYIHDAVPIIVTWKKSHVNNK